MNIFNRGDFKADNVDPQVKQFYTDTVDFDMDVKAEWNVFFYPAAKIYKKWSVRAEQMNFPVSDHQGITKIDSEIIKLNDFLDGRENVRAWIRSDRLNRKAFYAAAYSTFLSNEPERYYNVFFPLPFGGLTSILKITHFIETGVKLTSLSERRRADYQGVYQMIANVPLRLPINETICVWREGNEINATHVSWVFGIKALTLDYKIRKAKEWQDAK
ncbi:hypothetical protein [Mesobacillus harenae]|uniref:hypothetical protein n=1 Tax=Mesobacillus harenae TaxID=2213203 RepID=UPI001580D141|nr:hypothetical protein [Mesobacillus harenae]